MRTWMNFDIDPWAAPPRLALVGTSDWDSARLELVALAAELATLTRLALDELQHVPRNERVPQLRAECERLDSAAHEVLAVDAVWSNWSSADLEHAMDDFYAYLAGAGSVRNEISRLVARRPKRMR